MPQPPNTLAIDFGTSNSAAGIWRNGAPHVIEIEPGKDTFPTSVFFDFSSRDTLFGNPANAALLDGREGRYMRALKSVLGTTLMREKRYLMGEAMTFVDIIAGLLLQIKANAEAATGQRFTRVLSGRPVHFHSNDAGRDGQALIDLTECYHTAGFDDVQFLFEPEAAALASGPLPAGKTGLIVDIGGGTSDFCLFQSTGNGIDIIANHGVRVGGTDFDKSISVDHVMALFGKGSQIGKELGSGSHTAPNAIFQDLATWQMIPFLYTGDTRQQVAQLHRLALVPRPFARLSEVLELELGHDIAFAVERGKISANQAGGGTVDLSVVETGLHADLRAADLAVSLGGHMEKINTCAREILTMADCPPDRVDTVIFVGGSSLITAVERTMAGLFPGADLVYSSAFTAIIDGLATALPMPPKAP